MKLQFTFECFNKSINKEDIIRECLRTIFIETQRNLGNEITSMPSAPEAISKPVKGPIGFNK